MGRQLDLPLLGTAAGGRQCLFAAAVRTPPRPARACKSGFAAGLRPRLAWHWSCNPPPRAGASRAAPLTGGRDVPSSPSRLAPRLPALFPRPFPRHPQPAIARIGDAEDLAWLESAILLGSFAAGLPIAGALINLQLNLLFKGADSNELPDFWQKAQAWIEAYVQEAVADEIWTYVIEPKILAIGQSVVRVKDEQPADQYAAYAAIRLACDELRNTIAAAAANPTDGSECTKVLGAFRDHRGGRPRRLADP